MATISVSLPSDGSTADVADYNTPITTIVNEINGALDNSNIAAAAGIAGSKLADAGITNAKLATGAGEPGGAWQTWTPTLSGLFNDAKWTKACTYTRVGNTVFCKLLLTASTTTPMDGAGNCILTLPVTSVSYTYADGFPLGQAILEDTGTNDFLGYVVWTSTTTATVRMTTASTSIASKGAPTSTAPMTWTTGDFISAILVYEAA